MSNSSSIPAPVNYVSLISSLITFCTLLLYLILYLILKKDRIKGFFGKGSDSSPEAKIAERVSQHVVTHINIGEIRDKLDEITKKVTPASSLAESV